MKTALSNVAMRPSSFNESFYSQTIKNVSVKHTQQQQQQQNIKLSDSDHEMSPSSSTGGGGLTNSYSNSSSGRHTPMSDISSDISPILDTPRTPQFPLPDLSNPRLWNLHNDFLWHQDYSDFHRTNNVNNLIENLNTEDTNNNSWCNNASLSSFDISSDECPWTPDTPSSDTKDPLMTDAVNADSPTFSVQATCRERSQRVATCSKTESFGTLSNKVHSTMEYQKTTTELSYGGNKQSNVLKDSSSSFSTEPELMKSLNKPFGDLPFDLSTFSIPSFANFTGFNATGCNSISNGNNNGNSAGINNCTNNNSSSSSSASTSTNMNKRKPKLHLLQFIYCLLNSYKPSQCVCWVDRDDCIFRIINPNKLTNLWGRYKQNPNMSFDSLSRSLRLYYASGRLERVAGQRNQYRFVNREESIDFNRRNKRKNNHQQQQQQQQQSDQHSSTSMSSAGTSTASQSLTCSSSSPSSSSSSSSLSITTGSLCTQTVTLSNNNSSNLLSVSSHIKKSNGHAKYKLFAAGNHSSTQSYTITQHQHQHQQLQQQQQQQQQQDYHHSYRYTTTTNQNCSKKTSIMYGTKVYCNSNRRII